MLLVYDNAPSSLYLCPQCRAEYKVPGLYVIDSIVRQSRHQFGPDKDVFAARFTKNIVTTFQNMLKCPPDEKVCTGTGNYQTQGWNLFLIKFGKVEWVASQLAFLENENKKKTNKKMSRIWTIRWNPCVNQTFTFVDVFDNCSMKR